MSPEILNQLALALGQTLYMVGVSALIATVFGLPLGVFLATSERGEIFAAPIANRLLGAIVNATRSTPFIKAYRLPAGGASVTVAAPLI